MALVRDPNWDGPGDGPLIDDGTPVPEVKSSSGRGQFNAEQAAAIDAAAAKAGGSFSGATQDYIDRLAAGSEGGATDTLNALNILIQQGAAKYAGVSSPSTNTDPAPDPAAVVGGGSSFNEDAFAVLKKFLGTYGLTNSEATVRGLIVKGITDPDAILFELRETDDYKTRFAGNAKRVAKKLPFLLPGTYVGLENKFRDIMRARGLSDSFYNSNEDFQALIEGDVSPEELNNRIQLGYEAVKNADPEVIRQFKTLYNVDEAKLVEYFLDPAKTQPELIKAAEASKISARAKEQGGIQFADKVTAEELVNRGYSEAQALQAFTTLSNQKGLYDAMAGEETLSQGAQVGAAFGYDPAATEVLNKRKSKRLGEFKGGGSFTKTAGAYGTAGATESGLNVAQ